jgi:tricorn protease
MAAMSRWSFAVAFLLLPLTLHAAEPAASNVTLPRFPSISPDGGTVVFSWHGDLWSVPSEGGDARRLTATEAEELTSEFSPDGQRLAFVSDRRGPRGLFTMRPDGTGVEEVLVIDRAALLTDFADDGSLYFTGFIEPGVHRSPRPYRVDADGGVHERVHDAHGRTPRKEPGGERVLFVRGDSSWDRRGRTGPDTRDVWLYDPSAEEAFTKLTDHDGNDGRPRWLPGGGFVYSSDRVGGVVNLFARDLDGTGGEKQLTFSDDRDVEEYDLTPDGSMLVFARWDTLYTLDLTDDAATPQPIRIRGTDDNNRIAYVTVDSESEEAAISPDGKTLAVVGYGQIYVRSTDADAVTRRVSTSLARHSDVAWSPDGGTLYFTSDETGTPGIYAATVSLTRDDLKKRVQRERPAPDPERWPDAVRFAIEPVSLHAEGDRNAVPAPDGQRIALTRSRGDLVVLDLVTGKETPIFDGWDAGIDYLWSPDGNHLIYVAEDADFNADVWVAAADGTGEATNLTRHPDNDYLPQLSADGRILMFISERRDEEYDAYWAYLDASLEALAPAELDAYFEQLSELVKKQGVPDVPGFAEERGTVSPLAIKTPEPTTQPATRPSLRGLLDSLSKLGEELDEKSDEVLDERFGRLAGVANLDSLDLDTTYLRLRRVTSDRGSETEVLLLPDASAFYYVGAEGLRRVTREGSSTDAGGRVDLQNATRTGDKIAFLARGSVGVLQGTDRSDRGVSDRLEVDLQEQNARKFDELTRTLGIMFYHPTMKGLDWPALVERYRPLAASARTPGEFEHVANRLLGELNGSHLGVYAPDEADRPMAVRFGRLGIETQVVDDGFEVLDVLPTGPAGVGEMRLKKGDVITHLDLEPVEVDQPLETQLANTVDREVAVQVTRLGVPKTLLLTPRAYGMVNAAAYADWVEGNRREVEKLSAGRLGYLHVRGMDATSLEAFERDLYAAAEGKDGLVLDVRDNGGGWTTDRLLAALLYPQHAYTIPRGMRDSSEADRRGMRRGGYPQDRLFIQRYNLPANLLANQKSFSNAEIFAHAFKNLGRGTLIGEQTAGGVISTGLFTLVDGTRVRLPFRGWYLPDDRDMENNGAVPDLIVERTPAAEAAGRDDQLVAAVEELLGRIDQDPSAE